MGSEDEGGPDKNRFTATTLADVKPNLSSPGLD